MKRRILIALLAAGFFIGSTSAQDRNPSILLVGRIFVTRNYSLFDSLRQYYLNLGHTESYAVGVANGQVNADAEERLSRALDDLKATNPATFNTVMARYGVDIREK